MPKRKVFTNSVTIDGCYNYFLSNCLMATSYLSWKELVTGKTQNFCSYNKLKMIALSNKLLTKVTMVEVLKSYQVNTEHSWNTLYKWLTQLWDCTASLFWLGVKTSQLNNKCLKIHFCIGNLVLIFFYINMYF